jgi:hypothetical protein
MAKDRIYFVGPAPTSAGDGSIDQDASRATPRLVRATRQGPALMFAARDAFTVRVATQNDLEALLAKGVKVEDASEA